MSEAKSPQILMVDDDPRILSGFLRTVGRKFALTCAEGGAAALDAIKTGGPFPVVVTDMRMPCMNGIQFIEAARQINRDAIFMMLTGNADQQTAIDAINQGQIFRFLNKPCTPETLEQAIRAALRQYELVIGERVLLRETFAGSMKFMSEALELANSELATFQSSVKLILQEACRELGIRPHWQISVASTLCLIGLMTMPGIKINAALDEETLIDASMYGSHLMSHIPRISEVISMIRRQRDNPGLLPHDLRSLTGEALEAVGAQLLRFSVDLAREQLKTKDRGLAANNLAQAADYDPRLLKAFCVAPSAQEAEAKMVVRTLPIDEAKPGMIIDVDIKDDGRAIVFPKGMILSELGIVKLCNFAKLGTIESTITVRVPAPPAAPDTPAAPDPAPAVAA
jgi:CheY-like chemotaxis protein